MIHRELVRKSGGRILRTLSNEHKKARNAYMYADLRDWVLGSSMMSRIRLSVEFSAVIDMYLWICLPEEERRCILEDDADDCPYEVHPGTKYGVNWVLRSSVRDLHNIPRIGSKYPKNE